MIQDIFPHVYHNEYRPETPSPESFILIYEENQILYQPGTEEDSFSLPRFRELEDKLEDLYENYIYLFSIDDDRFYMIPGLDPSLLEDHSFNELRSLRLVKPRHLSFAGVTGHQLFQWYKNRKYCGQCGRPMIHSRDERMMLCPVCGRHEYPQLMPAVIVGVISKDRILLTKYAGRSFKLYALIAGFAEIGETIEETVSREVMEEVGLKVKNIRYYKSQPWSFSGTLLFGFYCNVDGSDEITLDRNELSLAQWFDRKDVEGQGNDASLTNEMMMTFAEGKEPK